MDIYRVKLTGTMPLLMHADNIEWADRMTEWKNNVKNKGDSRAGDDRTPAFRWMGCLYHDPRTRKVAIPREMIMACLMKAGAQVNTGKGKKTFKAQTQSGMMPTEDCWSLEVAGQEISMDEINTMMDEPEFPKHQAFAVDHGFQLFLKRAKVGTSKHIRVRPRFDSWSVSGTLSVWDDKLTIDILRTMFEYGGQYIGIGDWRPGGSTPGPFGIFDAKIDKAA